MQRSVGALVALPLAGPRNREEVLLPVRAVNPKAARRLAERAESGRMAPPKQGTAEVRVSSRCARIVEETAC
jgi:hypothetical protein